ncbi:MAG: Gfo/Idh/MocA family oxidoreductase [Planctomycetaceae bacterium]|jgi:predicted dehydrogenase|nr:Gfo/Idh/MocA family oxidoreductase [Planctomycetaceae bacterium]
MNRRTFHKVAAAALTATAAAQSVASYARVIGANDKIRLGFLGTANRGMQDISAFKVHSDIEIAALCDVDSKTLGIAKEKYGNDATFTAEDFRKVYEQNDIDAIVVATPDHWHAIQTIEACRAGKDVYVEKPVSSTVYEGRKMVEAADKYKRVVQVGIHRRSGAIYQKLEAMNLDEFIGKVTVSRCCHLSNMFPDGIGKLKPEKPPETLNWDLWLGPRAVQEYQPNIAPYKFRWWKNYSSQIANNGVHFLDLFRQMLKEKAPSDVCAMGGNFSVNDDRTIPDTLHVTWLFPSGRLLEFSHYEANSNPITAEPGWIEFRGTKGTLWVNDGRYLVKPEKPGQFQAKGERMKEIEEKAGAGQQNLNITALHARNFLDCIRSRAVPNMGIEEGHRSTTMSNIANISLAVGRRLKWDAEAEKFIGDDEANGLLHYEYRKPWKLEV